MKGKFDVFEEKVDFQISSFAIWVRVPGIYNFLCHLIIKHTNDPRIFLTFMTKNELTSIEINLCLIKVLDCATH